MPLPAAQQIRSLIISPKRAKQSLKKVKIAALRSQQWIATPFGLAMTS
jgi:hypothetical protein